MRHRGDEKRELRLAMGAGLSEDRLEPGADRLDGHAFGARNVADRLAAADAAGKARLRGAQAERLDQDVERL